MMRESIVRQRNPCVDARRQVMGGVTAAVCHFHNISNAIGIDVRARGYIHLFLPLVLLTTVLRCCCCWCFVLLCVASAATVFWGLCFMCAQQCTLLGEVEPHLCPVPPRRHTDNRLIKTKTNQNLKSVVSHGESAPNL